MWHSSCQKSVFVRSVTINVGRNSKPVSVSYLIQCMHIGKRWLDRVLNKQKRVQGSVSLRIMTSQFMISYSHTKIQDGKMHTLRCMGPKCCVKFPRCTQNLNPYTAKCAFYEVLKIGRLMIFYNYDILSLTEAGRSCCNKAKPIKLDATIIEWTMMYCLLGYQIHIFDGIIEITVAALCGMNCFKWLRLGCLKSQLARNNMNSVIQWGLVTNARTRNCGTIGLDLWAGVCSPNCMYYLIRCWNRVICFLRPKLHWTAKENSFPFEKSI